MADNTPRLDLERFDQGDASWDHTDTVEAVDENAIVHGPIADRPTTGTYDDELYHATDQNITWRWDNTSSDWVHFSGLGSESQRVPGTSHLTDIDVNTLADTALSGQIDTTQLSDDAVTAAKIAAAAVQSEQIATDAVGSAEIATDAVSVDELAAALGTTSSNRVPGTTHFEESSHEALEAVNTISEVYEQKDGPSKVRRELLDVRSGDDSDWFIDCSGFNRVLVKIWSQDSVNASSKWGVKITEDSVPFDNNNYEWDRNFGESSSEDDEYWQILIPRPGQGAAMVDLVYHRDAHAGRNGFRAWSTRGNTSPDFNLYNGGVPGSVDGENSRGDGIVIFENLDDFNAGESSFTRGISGYAVGEVIVDV